MSIPSMTATTPKPAAASDIVATELTADSLVRLAGADIGAIHVRGYFPREVAEVAIQRAIEHPALGNYHKKHTSSVGRVFMPHIDTKRDAELTARYHEAALPSIEDVRSIFLPYLSPVDQLRLHLQERWPAGANILRLRGRTCFVGAMRVFQPQTSRFYPHNDWLLQETDAPEVEGVTEQFVANMYLQVPRDGGDLQLWLRAPTAEETETILELEGLEPDSIEPPTLTIHPEAGDLIIFSSRMLHAVTAGEDRDTHRVGMAAFIAAQDPSRPLVCWS
jgi:2OG-Fe(II) oxygenase superfamily